MNEKTKDEKEDKTKEYIKYAIGLTNQINQLDIDENVKQKLLEKLHSKILIMIMNLQNTYNDNEGIETRIKKEVKHE
jgi:hypothetical protein